MLSNIGWMKKVSKNLKKSFLKSQREREKRKMTGFLETLTTEIVEVLAGDVSYQMVIAYLLLPP